MDLLKGVELEPENMGREGMSSDSSQLVYLSTYFEKGADLAAGSSLKF